MYKSSRIQGCIAVIFLADLPVQIWTDLQHSDNIFWQTLKFPLYFLISLYRIMGVVPGDPSTASSSATAIAMSSTQSCGSNSASCFMQDLDFSFVLRLLQRQPGRARLPNLTATLMGFSHPVPRGGCEIPLSAPYLAICIMFTPPCCSLASVSP